MILDWVHAPDVPSSWDGEWVLEWQEHDKLGLPRLRLMNTNYSRNPLHCGGFWFARFNLPVDRRLIAKRASLAKQMEHL